jgi:hypothetical protein
MRVQFLSPFGLCDEPGRPANWQDAAAFVLKPAGSVVGGASQHNGRAGAKVIESTPASRTGRAVASGARLGGEFGFIQDGQVGMKCQMGFCVKH